MKRLLALDLGDKRIGVAVSDTTAAIARPLTVIRRESRRSDFQKIGNLVKENEAAEIVVGLPLTLSGIESSRTEWTRDYARDLGDKLNLDIILWDESFSTADAIENLRDQGKDPKRYRNKIDAIAAAYILQSYLDSQATET